MNETSTPSPGSLYRNGSFYSLVLTQFLGAFNDNIYKTTLALLFVAVPGIDATGQEVTYDRQGTGNLLFALPFILFSGWAGYLSDRYSKWRVMFLCKVAEIGIMLLGLVLFVQFGEGPMNTTWLVVFFVMLFGMGTHSAFFGPGKYGILPELFPKEQLPQANGFILMTTFLAIILGVGTAGWLKDASSGWLAPIGLLCTVVAICGTVAALGIRRVGATDPALRFSADQLLIPRPLWRLLLRDGPLAGALIASSIFWLAAGLVASSVVALGKLELKLSDTWSTLLLSAVSLGIVIGAPLAGWLSAGRFHVGVMRTGAFGISGSLALLVVPGSDGQLAGFAGSFLCLIGSGLFSGLLAVPLQVFLQMRPPAELKGSMIGAMNLLNFLGIVLAGLVYEAMSQVLSRTAWPPSYGFLVPSLCMLAVAVGYRPAGAALQAASTDD
jgi:acyl-[acyl-carrier-protein]-phospholipid O-acyltransferase/long-chain-fatty-acid--[acyl-carrier-protein] ligase